MRAVLRNYQGPEDLDLQQRFWVERTKTLPWCWKPTTSPYQYSSGPQFDPRSRRFAFEGNQLVGYMSFTGQGEFVSLGYPWVLPGYEGELQEELYDAVYGFAAGPEYGGRVFAQRFRRQWTTQIDFFTRHGFAVQRSEPIYGWNLAVQAPSQPFRRIRVEVLRSFQWEEFERLTAARLEADRLANLRVYFQTVDFDFAVRATERNALAAYLGVTVRSDTGLAELIAVAFENGATDAIVPCLAAAIDQCRLLGASFLASKSIPEDGASDLLIGMGFKKVSEEVFFSKSL